MALLLCGLSLLQFTPSCAVWKLTQIFLITTATCRGPSSTVSLWVETQTPLLPWQAPLQGLIMGRNRYPQVGSRAVKLFKRHRSWQIACMNCTASGSELQGEPVFGRRSGGHLCFSGQKSGGGSTPSADASEPPPEKDTCCCELRAGSTSWFGREGTYPSVVLQLGSGCMWRLGQWVHLLWSVQERLVFHKISASCFVHHYAILSLQLLDGCLNPLTFLLFSSTPLFQLLAVCPTAALIGSTPLLKHQLTLSWPAKGCRWETWERHIPGEPGGCPAWWHRLPPVFWSEDAGG